MAPEPAPRTAPEAAGGAPRLGDALEFAALGLGVTLVAALLGRLPSWLHPLATFQSLFAVGFGFFALTLSRLERYERLPRVGLAVAAVAVASRLLLLTAAPSLSGDVYRYVWEGRVASHGGNPYRQSPLDPALHSLRDADVWPHVNHPELATIYPPLAEAGFAAVARLSPTVWAMKLWVVLHDVALVLILIAWSRRRGVSPAAVVAYAWNPLVLVEYAGSGHNDPTAMVWLVLALMLAGTRPSWSAAALAAGALTKLVPLAALPFLWRAWPWRARAVAALLLVPGLAWFVFQSRTAYSGLAAYWGSWRNNELLFHYLDRGSGGFAAARTISLVSIAGIAAWAWWRRHEAARATRLVLRAATLLSPVVHPWYLGWTLAFEPLRPSAPWLLLSFMVILNYGVLATAPEARWFHLPLAWRWVEYGVPAVLAAGLALRRRRAG